jgi:hypothetical protein
MCYLKTYYDVEVLFGIGVPKAITKIECFCLENVQKRSFYFIKVKLEEIWKKITANVLQKNIFESSNLSLTEQKFRFLYKFLQNKHQKMFATGFKAA